MKKTVLAILMTMVATTAYARLEKCTSENGGLLFQGGNGQSYCISRREMNWWSAFSWCKGVGGELATIDDACPGTGFDTCTNIADKQTKVVHALWLATPSSSDRANAVYAVGGSIGSLRRVGGDFPAFALCY